MKIKFLLALGLAGAGMLWNQVVGATISGTVRDGSGANVTGASVSVKNIETGAERKLVTDARRYRPHPSRSASTR